MLALTAGLKTEYLIDLKVFRLATELSAAKGCWKQARQALKIKRLGVWGLGVRDLGVGGLRIDSS